MLRSSSRLFFLVLATAFAAFASPSSEPAPISSITLDEARVLAVNDLVAEGTGLVLRHPNIRVFGQILNGNGAQVGYSDVRISFVGGTGSNSSRALRPAVAFNSIYNQYQLGPWPLPSSVAQ